MSEALKVKNEIKLREPVKQGSELISVLFVRKPKAKDFRALPAEGASTGDILDFAAKLVGQPPSVVDELCMEDFQELMEVVGNFVMPGQMTGNSV
jgi:hypothetical protein